MIGQLRATPNQLTLLRLIFIPLIVVLVVDREYRWAFALFFLAGLTDGLDGILARVLKQKTELGQILDPIADKLLLSTMFLVFSLMHKIPWRITVVVFGRDVIIVLICGVLYMTGTLKNFRPSFYGKANTVSQILTVIFVFLDELVASPWVTEVKELLFWLTFTLTVISAILYVLKVARELAEPGVQAPQP